MEAVGVVRLRSSISVSILAHIFLLVMWTFLVRNQAAQIDQKTLRWIELEPIDVASLSKKKIKDDLNSKRIVQTTRGQEVAQAAPDAFLGERNQVVDRQTVNKNQTTAMGKNDPVDAKPKVERVKPTTFAKGALSNLGVEIIPKSVNQPNQVENIDDRNWVAGESLPQDYVKGLKTGDRTALNTKEFVFFGYFQRIRQRLDLAWSTSLRNQLLKIYKNGRRLASDMDHTTKVLVTLSARGEIVRVQVLEESGTRDLDEAAVTAFNKAGPFPNPPKGIVNKNGLIEIRWDFVLKS